MDRNWNVFGTEMHIITFIFTLFEVVMFFHQTIYFLSRPNDKSRQWYLILLFLLISYNITGGLFPDKNISSVPLTLQYITAYGTGFLMAMYFPFYFYKAWGLEKMRYHALYGVFVFLLLPFLVFFVVVYLFTGDIVMVRKIGVVVPFFYSLSLFYSLTKAVHFKYKDKSNRDNKEIVGIYLAVIPWMSLTIVTYFNASQAIEVSFTNGGLIVASVLFIRQTIRKSREEYDKLQELNLKLEEKVNEKTKKLQQINEQKTNTFVNLAHETKTPLTLINNYLEDYIEKTGDTEELTRIKSHMDKLTNDIVNFFDLERSQKGFYLYNHNQVCNFSNVLNDSIHLFKQYGKKKNILIEEFSEENVFVKADPDAIYRIVNNLLENSIKYSPEGTKIEINLSVSEGKIRFTVRDEGIGIPLDLQNKIFEPYFQINSEKRVFQGMGLGLSIVKHIIESLNGEIVLSSDPNILKGTEFTVLLRSHELKDAETVGTVKNKDNIKYNIETLLAKDEVLDDKRPAILLVEDNVPMLNYLTAKLKVKYNIYVALNGLEALKKLENIRKLDLIISDVMMDKVNGFEFFKALTERQHLSHIPFIFLTAKDTKKDRIKGLNLGAVDYIQKPFIITELIQKIDALLQTINRQKSAFLNNLVNHAQALNQTDALPSSLPTPIVDVNAKFETNSKKFNLTTREIEIVKLIIKGEQYKSIGDQLNISERTIHSHVRKIFEKVDVNNKFDLKNKMEA